MGNKGDIDERNKKNIRKNDTTPYFNINEERLCDFYVQMNKDCVHNASRAVWELLRNAPYFEMLHTDKIKLGKKVTKL